MTELQKKAKEYLILKGVKSTGDKFIALEVMDLLCEFAQGEQLNIGGVSGCYSIEQLQKAVNFWAMTYVDRKYIKDFLNNH